MKYLEVCLQTSIFAPLFNRKHISLDYGCLLYTSSLTASTISRLKTMIAVAENSKFLWLEIRCV